MRFPFWTPAFAGVTGFFNILLGLRPVPPARYPPFEIP
jgi:hypothetical protein